jgi:molecular chaperone HtpG
MLKNDRDKYETFFKTFGKVIKYGVYSDWGINKDFLQDLLMFYSSKEKKLVTLDEYISRMKEDQKYIYYATGSSIEKIDRLPQTEFAKDKDYEILYLTEEVDEFAIKMLFKYKDKEFKSVSSDEEKTEEKNEDNKDIFEFLKETLKDKVKDVKPSTKLKTHPACITSAGELSIEMEKVLKMMPNSEGVKAEKILEINTEHNLFKVIKDSFETDKEKVKTIARILYNQSLLIEGLDIEDPVEYANDIYSLIK